MGDPEAGPVKCRSQRDPRCPADYRHRRTRCAQRTRTQVHTGWRSDQAAANPSRFDQSGHQRRFRGWAGTIATGWTQAGVGVTRVCSAGSPLVYAGTCAAQLVYTGQATSFKQVFVQGAATANYAWLSARINKHGATGTIQATLIGGDGSKLKLNW